MLNKGCESLTPFVKLLSCPALAIALALWVLFIVGCLTTADYNLTTGTLRPDSPPDAYLPDNGENIWRKNV